MQYCSLKDTTNLSLQVNPILLPPFLNFVKKMITPPILQPLLFMLFNSAMQLSFSNNDNPLTKTQYKREEMGVGED